MEVQPWVAITIKIMPAILVIVIIMLMAYLLKREKTSRSLVTNNDNDNPNLYLTILGLNISKASMSIVLLVIGGIPLLIYPFVLIANAMQLAAFGASGNEKMSVYLAIIVLLFLALSTAYPLTYILCCCHKKRKENIYISVAPILHLAIIVLVGYLWSVLQTVLSPS